MIIEEEGGKAYEEETSKLNNDEIQWVAVGGEVIAMTKDTADLLQYPHVINTVIDSSTEKVSNELPHDVNTTTVNKGIITKKEKSEVEIESTTVSGRKTADDVKQNKRIFNDQFLSKTNNSKDMGTSMNKSISTDPVFPSFQPVDLAYMLHKVKTEASLPYYVLGLFNILRRYFPRHHKGELLNNIRLIIGSVQMVMDLGRQDLDTLALAHQGDIAAHVSYFSTRIIDGVNRSSSMVAEDVTRYGTF